MQSIFSASLKLLRMGSVSSFCSCLKMGTYFPSVYYAPTNRNRKASLAEPFSIMAKSRDFVV
jgi:hypothetical protein